MAVIAASDSDATGDVSVTVDSVQSNDGKIRADVSVISNPGIWDLRVVVEFDKEALTLEKVESSGKFSLVDGPMGDVSSYILYFENETSDTTATGKLATLVFQPKHTDEYQYPILLASGEAFNYSSKEVTVSLQSGVATNAKIAKFGDINGDGKVNGLDSLEIRKLIAGNPSQYSKESMDLTGDGKVNGLDSLKIRKYLAGNPDPDFEKNVANKKPIDFVKNEIQYQLPVYEDVNLLVYSPAGQVPGGENLGSDVYSVHIGSETSSVVIPSTPQSTIALNKSSLSIEVGSKSVLTATVNPIGSTVTWSSSKPSVATVSNGTVSAISAGTATITASINGSSASCIVTVSTVPVTGINLDKSSLSLEKGMTSVLTATVLPSNATVKDVSWSSSNSSVATISKGVVTAISSGSTTITAKTIDGGYTSTCVVNVVERVSLYFMADGKSVLPTAISVIPGENYTEPAVPFKEGYTGSWPDYSFNSSTVIINAVYTPIEYVATFVDISGKVVSKVGFTVEDDKINEPPVPEYYGRSGVWEPYTISAHNMTIKPSYSIAMYYKEGFSVEKGIEKLWSTTKGVYQIKEYKIGTFYNYPVSTHYLGTGFSILTTKPTISWSDTSLTGLSESVSKSISHTDEHGWHVNVTTNYIKDIVQIEGGWEHSWSDTSTITEDNTVYQEITKGTSMEITFDENVIGQQQYYYRMAWVCPCDVFCRVEINLGTGEYTTKYLFSMNTDLTEPVVQWCEDGKFDLGNYLESKPTKEMINIDQSAFNSVASWGSTTLSANLKCESSYCGHITLNVSGIKCSYNGREYIYGNATYAGNPGGSRFNDVARISLVDLNENILFGGVLSWYGSYDDNNESGVAGWSGTLNSAEYYPEDVSRDMPANESIHINITGICVATGKTASQTLPKLENVNYSANVTANDGKTVSIINFNILGMRVSDDEGDYIMGIAYGSSDRGARINNVYDLHLQFDSDIVKFAGSVYWHGSYDDNNECGFGQWNRDDNNGAPKDKARFMLKNIDNDIAGNEHLYMMVSNICLKVPHKEVSYVVPTVKSMTMKANLYAESTPLSSKKMEFHNYVIEAYGDESINGYGVSFYDGTPGSTRFNDVATVRLYDIDTTVLGAGMLHWYGSRQDGNECGTSTWRGNTGIMIEFNPLETHDDIAGNEDTQINIDGIIVVLERYGA